MKISNLINSKGDAVKNQFIIQSEDGIIFQSYQSKIIKVKGNYIYVYKNYNYSRTTAKHRNKFLSDLLGIDINSKMVEKMLENGKIGKYSVNFINE